MTKKTTYYFSVIQLLFFIRAFVVSLTSGFSSMFIRLSLVIVILSINNNLFATVYTVSDKATLQTRMNSALPGDTVIVSNGTYNWGQIVFTNNNSTSNSPWIVLKAQSLSGVIFTGATYLQFKGTRVEVNGFKFASGNSGSNAVVSFRSSSSSLSNYCRITNITFDNYNSDSETDNEWVALYGTNNRVDHCTFINKSNVRATIVVWYSTTTYPNPAISTYHRIDSNYFKGRSYLGSNGGETIRVGDSNSSRTNGYNTIEFNLFEDCIQTEPEIISNKSNFNVYRYNTFKNSRGGLTLRHGRYCSVYGNFFIVDDPAVTQAYGIRVIDKGHKIFNNYFEGVNGNSGSLTSARTPICLYNGLSSTLDTNDASKASGYFPADSSIVAFNTIANAKGGAGIVLGYTDGGANTFQPLGIMVSNNIIKMAQGQAVLLSATNTSLTYSAEGNIYQAPSGLGIASSTGFTNASFSFGSRVNDILRPPSTVQDAAANSNNYTQLLSGFDALGRARSNSYDVGCVEIDGTGPVLYHPLISALVGAGTPSTVLPIQLLSFKAYQQNNSVKLDWMISSQKDFHSFDIEWSDGSVFKKIGEMKTNQSISYSFTHLLPQTGKNIYRLKLVDEDGSYSYSHQAQVNMNDLLRSLIYPNPAKNVLNFQILNNALPALLNIYDQMGLEVLGTMLSVSNTSLNVASLKAGVYHVKLKILGNNIYNQQVLIIR